MPPAPRPARMETDEIAAFLEGVGLAADARILDVPCGIGRRAHGLAERGYHVTAVDPNPVAIEGLRRRVPKALEDRLRCRAAEKDALPGSPPAEPFDAILCLDHALGRGAAEADAAFLGRLRACLVPGGILVVELLHRDFFAARPRPFAYHLIGDVEQHEFRTFDPASGILELTWKFYQRQGQDLRFRGTSSARLRLLAPHEVAALLGAAGWRVEAWYGGWQKEAISADRRKVLALARPAARS